jgi:putative nucleotidyltransferase with HDIG domain
MLLTDTAALVLLRDHVKNEKMIQHSLASCEVLKAIARKLNQDEAKYGQAGLLHDIDVEFTNADAATHGPVGANWLAQLGVDHDVVDAIRMHNEMATGLERSTTFQHALAAGETITGLIMATALVYPDKQLASVKTKSVTKRMKEKAFAASVKRENILECEKIGIPIDEFAELAIQAMLPIHTELGL